MLDLPDLIHVNASCVIIAFTFSQSLRSDLEAGLFKVSGLSVSQISPFALVY